MNSRAALYHRVSIVEQNPDAAARSKRSSSRSPSARASAALPENLRGYFDYEAFARDAELGADIVSIATRDGQVHVFWASRYPGEAGLCRATTHCPSIAARKANAASARTRARRAYLTIAAKSDAIQVRAAPRSGCVKADSMRAISVFANDRSRATRCQVETAVATSLATLRAADAVRANCEAT